MEHPKETVHRNPGMPTWLLEATELKAAALDRLSSTPLAMRDRPVPRSDWSASGIIEHLVLTEELIAGPWKEALAKLPDAKTGLKSELLARFVAFGMGRTPLRVPTVPGLEPAGGRSLAELERRWECARQELVRALPTDADVAWILHPALGTLSSAQMGRILASHLKHHMRHWTPASTLTEGMPNK